MSRSTVSYVCHRQHSAGLCRHPAGITLVTLDRHVERIALRELAKLEVTASQRDRTLARIRSELRAAEDEIAAYLEGVSAAGLSPGQYARGARLRREAIERQREKLSEALARRPGQVDGDPVKVWRELDVQRRNQLLRSLLECVLIAPAGRGKRVPVADRVRVIAYGAGIADPYKGGGIPRPIESVALPDRDDPVVLGMDLLEHPLEHPRG